jgi:uncharacterized protein (DUF2147 family)
MVGGGRTCGWPVFALLLALLLPGAAAAQALTPVGVWEDASNRIQVEIAPCEDRLCGRLVWFRWPDDDDGVPVVDLKNRDPALRMRPLLGLTILRNLRHTGDNTWEGGEIYNPEDGVDYRSRMSLRDDGSLRVRAYLLLLPLLGETKIWTRIR